MRHGQRVQVIWLRRYGAVCLSMLAVAAFLNMAVVVAGRSVLQNGIAGEVLRFHVLANSDSAEDQRVKLLVRDRVLQWMEEAEESDRNRKQGVSNRGKAQMKAFAASHLEEIEAEADAVLQEQNAPYRAEASLERCYFPERTYGDCTFPAGWYEALRVRLGKADGHNWWCVLYPRLCFTDCLHAEVEEGQMQQLEEVLTEEEYGELLRSPDEWEIAFRWF